MPNRVKSYGNKIKSTPSVQKTWTGNPRAFYLAEYLDIWLKGQLHPMTISKKLCNIYCYHLKKSYITKSHVKKNTLLSRQYSISLKQRHNDMGAMTNTGDFVFTVFPSIDNGVRELRPFALLVKFKKKNNKKNTLATFTTIRHPHAMLHRRNTVDITAASYF